MVPFKPSSLWSDRLNCAEEILSNPVRFNRFDVRGAKKFSGLKAEVFSSLRYLSGQLGQNLLFYEKVVHF